MRDGQDGEWETRLAPDDAPRASLRPLAALLVRLAEAELAAEQSTSETEANLPPAAEAAPVDG
jgi:hypothetical protein